MHHFELQSIEFLPTDEQFRIELRNSTATTGGVVKIIGDLRGLYEDEQHPHPNQEDLQRFSERIQAVVRDHFQGAERTRRIQPTRGEIYRRRDGKWAFRIKAANGEVIATDGGQGYAAKADASSTLERLLRGSAESVIDDVG